MKPILEVRAKPDCIVERGKCASGLRLEPPKASTAQISIGVKVLPRALLDIGFALAAPVFGALLDAAWPRAVVIGSAALLGMALLVAQAVTWFARGRSERVRTVGNPSA